jgi:hypothetical protein
VWSLVLFQVFLTGLFSLRKSFWLVGFMVPLIAYTIWWGWTMSRDFDPLSKYLALSNICDVQRGEEPVEVVAIGNADDQLPQTLSGLNHKRYSVNDDTLYVAPADKRTDYSQPPMNSFYYGVLNTGKRRYGHPALTGSLPKPWLPAKARPPAFGDDAAAHKGVVLSLRRKMAKKLRRKQSATLDVHDERERLPSGGTFGPSEGWDSAMTSQSSEQNPSSSRGNGATTPGGQVPGNKYSSSTINSNPWARDSTPSPALDYGPELAGRSDMVPFPEEHIWDDEDNDNEDDESPGEPVTPASPVSCFVMMSC